MNDNYVIAMNHMSLLFTFTLLQLADISGIRVASKTKTGFPTIMQDITPSSDFCKLFLSPVLY